MKNPFIAAVLSLAVAVPALANGPEQRVADSGFYGGVSLRDRGAETGGISFGHLAATSPWTRFAAITREETGARTLAYGGFRWANDFAVEAAVGSTEQTPSTLAAPVTRRGVGLSLSGNQSPTLSNWNVDLFTSWSVRPSFALYGRLGYAANDAAVAYAPVLLPDLRRNRDGVSYGLGLRYDMSPALGLRLEYARFGRLPGEAISGFLPESDQLQFGVQFRF